MTVDASPTALVTGASQGIGRAVAELLLGRGYAVHGTYNASLDDAAAMVERHPGLQMHRADLRQPQAVDELLEAIKGVRLDALVNNAGVFESDGFDAWSEATWRAVLEVNLTAPARLAISLRHQLKPNGAIVNVASVDGMIGSFHSMAYSASKAALINLTHSLGNVYGQRGVRVNAVSPGWIETRMATPETREASEITPLGRGGEPVEVAEVVAFLIGSEARFVNGANVVVDGGYRNVSYVTLRESQRAGG